MTSSDRTSGYHPAGVMCPSRGDLDRPRASMRPAGHRRVNSRSRAARHRHRAIACEDPRMVRLEVGVLGPLAVHRDGVPIDVRATKPRSLLATLALHHDRIAAADTLVTFLWDEPLPERADHALQQHISALRKALLP